MFVHECLVYGYLELHTRHDDKGRGCHGGLVGELIANNGNIPQDVTTDSFP